MIYMKALKLDHLLRSGIPGMPWIFLMNDMDETTILWTGIGRITGSIEAIAVHQSWVVTSQIRTQRTVAATNKLVMRVSWLSLCPPFWNGDEASCSFVFEDAMEFLGAHVLFYAMKNWAYWVQYMDSNFVYPESLFLFLSWNNMEAFALMPQEFGDLYFSHPAWWPS